MKRKYESYTYVDELPAYVLDKIGQAVKYYTDKNEYNAEPQELYDNIINSKIKDVLGNKDDDLSLAVDKILRPFVESREADIAAQYNMQKYIGELCNIPAFSVMVFDDGRFEIHNLTKQSATYCQGRLMSDSYFSAVRRTEAGYDYRKYNGLMMPESKYTVSGYGDIIDFSESNLYEGVSRMNKPIKFKSGQDMLDTICNGIDLYSPETEQYVFLYNDEYSICVHWGIETEDADEFAELCAKDDGYWSECIPGGHHSGIYDDPSSYDYHKGQPTNLDWCEDNYQYTWYDTRTWNSAFESYKRESNIKQNREKSVMKDDGIHYKNNIDYSESHIMVKGDTFYEIYHNPDAGSGDQFVGRSIPLDSAIKLYDECDRNFSEFYDMISSEGKVYLADIDDGSGDYTAFKNDWKDGIEFTQKNLEKLLFGKTENKRSIKESRQSIADETDDYFYVFADEIIWVHFGVDDNGEYVEDYTIPSQTWEQAVKDTNNNVDKLFDYLAQNCRRSTFYKNEFRKAYDSYNPTADDSIFATGISSNTVNAIQKQFDRIAHIYRPMPNKHYSVYDYREHNIENFETEEEAIEYAIHNKDAEKVYEVENGLARPIWDKDDYDDEIECDECGERWPSLDIKKTSMGNLCPQCLDYLIAQGYDVDVHYGESMRSRRAKNESYKKARPGTRLMENSVYDMNYSYDEFLENGNKYVTWYSENPLCMCPVMTLRIEDGLYDGVHLIPTVNLGHDIGNNTLMPKYCAFIDVYNNPEIDTWLEEKGLAEPYRRFGSDVEMQGNFGTYPLYQFSKEAFKKYGFDGLDEYEENWQKEFEKEQSQMNKDFYSQYVQESNNKNWYESEFTQDERSAKDKLLKYLKTKSIPFEVSGMDAEIDGKIGSLGWNVRINATPEQAEEINTMIDNKEFDK